MTETAVKLYEGNSETYDRFVSLFRYQQGIESFFSRWKPLDSAERILDAGCGTGLVTVALVDAMEKRDLTYDEIHGFDITPAMLEKFRERVEKRDIPDVTARWADVRDLETLPPSWQDYDLIVSASMLEYVREDELALALSGLRSRLSSDGRLLFFCHPQESVDASAHRLVLEGKSVLPTRSAESRSRGRVFRRLLSPVSLFVRLVQPLGPHRRSCPVTIPSRRLPRSWASDGLLPVTHSP